MSGGRERPPKKMAKIVYVTVRDRTLPEDENYVGWGLVVNGRLVALDDSHYSSFISEIADGLAAALEAEVKDVIVDVEGSGWDWHRDVLPKVSAPLGPEVVLSVQGDIEELVKYDDCSILPKKVRKAIAAGWVTPKVIRRAAEIARDAILEGGYWDYLQAALECAIAEAVEEAEERAGANV